MKRLYIALCLLAAVMAVCVCSHRYQHCQIDRMLSRLEQIEAAVRSGDNHAVQMAEAFAADYGKISNRISCYVPHGELRESHETAALLPTLLREDNRDELWVELARLRSQLKYIQQLDDPSLQNIL